MEPLINQNIIPESRRKHFVKEVFYNIYEVHSVNSKLADALQKRQNSYAIVEQIGDIFLEYAPLFDPFIKYGAHQLWGKYEFEREKNSNHAFAKFVEVSLYFKFILLLGSYILSKSGLKRISINNLL